MNGENIRRKLKETGISLKEVAEKADMTPQSLNNLFKVSDVKVGVLTKLAKSINKSVYYFFDDPLPSNANGDTKDAVKYYDIDASASPIEMFDPGNGTQYKDLLIPGFGDCEIALNVWGDSMEPALNKGEIILCKEWKEQFIEFGYTYLIITKNNHRMIKYLQPGNSEDTVLCVSKNEFYKPFEIKRSDILKLFVVKGHVERSAI